MMDQPSLFSDDNGVSGGLALDGENLVYVYEELDQGIPTDRVKVGFTATGKPLKRIAQQKTGNSRDFRYIGAFVVSGKRDETEKLQELKPFKIYGGGDEWFRKTPESMRIINRWLRQPTVHRIARADLINAANEGLTVWYWCKPCNTQRVFVLRVDALRDHFATNRTLSFASRCPGCEGRTYFEIEVD
jgi:hypothetical protein